MRLADFVIDWLFKKNINTIFTVSGGGSIALCDALALQDKINYVCCHHEQSVAFAAEGYARTKLSLGVGIVTTGPGGTNAITGVASSWIDSIPLMIISGQVFSKQTIGDSNLRQLGVQESDVVTLSKPITKYSKMLTNKNDILYELEKCYHIANEGRKGPVWLDIPADLQNAQIEENDLKQYNFKKK